MDESKVDMFIIQKGKFFPSEQVPFIREKLLAFDDDKWTHLFTVKMKDPFMALMISILVGTVGADRFFLGQTAFGVCKLLLFIVFFFVYFAVIITSDEDPSWTLIVGFLLLTVAILTWYLIDIFNASRRAKEINLNLILTFFN